MTACSRSTSPPVRIAAALLFIGAFSAGCAGKGDTTGSLAPDNVRERHPIVLKDAPRSLDIFVGRSGAALDRRQSEDVADFAREYRQAGRGGMVAEVPTGIRRDGAARDTLTGIRAALARGGVSPDALSVRSYSVQDPSLASPIRLTFAKLQAVVPHECGQWPTDLGSSDFKFSASNEPYWNLGCASQATLAAQVADPIDLVRARDEGRPDIVKRMGAIAKIREGKDPSTEYRSTTPQINSNVGGGT